MAPATLLQRNTMVSSTIPRSREAPARSKSNEKFHQSWDTLETALSDEQPIMTSVDAIDQIELLASLGDGPMKFSPFCREKPIRKTLSTYEVAHIEKFVKVKMACENRGLDKRYTDEQILRVLIYKDFSVRKSMRLLKHMDARYVQSTVWQLEDQLRTKTLFPLPQLQSDSIDDFFYMRPVRHIPSVTPTSTVIANLIYVMNSLYEKHRDYNYKIGFIANMNDWKMKHFAHDYCLQFMLALQGHSAPVNVGLFLIVNPPSWFSKIWNIMKPMLAPGFRKKVHMIPEEKLGEFLQPGFSKYLPDEFKCGSARSASLVEDFITFRKHVEARQASDSILERSVTVWPTHRKGRVVRRSSTGAASRRSSGHSSIDDKLSNASFDDSDDVIESPKDDEPRRKVQQTNSSNLQYLIPDVSWGGTKDPWDDDDDDDSEGSLGYFH